MIARAQTLIVHTLRVGMQFVTLCVIQGSIT
ncbi:hypothetical protein SAMN05216596_10446 [Pseudomonas congelans]|uniref:Uncharacterized protein n=1 Tax=Pseudomonas congelans TaxID=200452 RepID=A0A1H0SG16_9PSED|nr:hypothetical protein SAMN05216596_10446 [Pseudomonas congelans]